LNAIRFAHEVINNKWIGSSELKEIGSGHLFGPDQNGWPCESVASRG
jgi:hypothetical protein